MRFIRTIGLHVLGLAMLLAALALPAGAIAAPITKEQKQAILRSAEKQVRDHAFAVNVDFDRWSEIVKKYQSSLDRATQSEEFTRVLNRALNEFGISHLDLMDPAAARQTEGGTFGGVGIRTTASRTKTIIDRVLPGSPAEKAGLKPGDELLLADGKPLDDVNVLRGRPGTEVAVTYRREGQNDQTVTIRRARVSFRDPETLTPIDDDTAVLRIPTFHADYQPMSVARLMIDAGKYKRLIIDLRGNPGGEVRHLLHFLGFFLPDGTAIGTSVTKRMTQEYSAETGGDPADLPAIAKWSREKFVVSRSTFRQFKGQIAVVIDRRSASASEIVTQTLIEQRDALTVGTRTAGAVLVSTYEDLPDGFRMKVPHSEFVSIKGRRLEGNPIVAAVSALHTPNDDAKKDATIKVAATKLRERDSVVEERRTVPSEQKPEAEPAGTR